jgi:hypothetical protein
MALNKAPRSFLHKRNNNLNPRFFEYLNPLSRVSLIWVQHCHHYLTNAGINQGVRT